MKACDAASRQSLIAVQSEDWDRVVSIQTDKLKVCQEPYAGVKDHDDVRDGMESGELQVLALALNKLGKFEDAIPVSRRCAALDAKNAFCWLELGQALEGAGRASDARQAYEQR